MFEEIEEEVVRIESTAAAQLVVNLQIKRDAIERNIKSLEAQAQELHESLRNVMNGNFRLKECLASGKIIAEEVK